MRYILRNVLCYFRFANYPNLVTHHSWSQSHLHFGTNLSGLQVSRAFQAFAIQEQVDKNALLADAFYVTCDYLTLQFCPCFCRYLMLLCTR